MNVAQFFAADTVQILLVKNRLKSFCSSPNTSLSKSAQQFAEIVVRIHLCEDVEVQDEHVHAYNCIYAHNSKRKSPPQRYREMTMLTDPDHIAGLNIAWRIICPDQEYASQLSH